MEYHENLKTEELSGTILSQSWGFGYLTFLSRNPKTMSHTESHAKRPQN